jgi:hypothetical protein
MVPPDLLGETLVPIVAQIECAERELRYRLRVYPRWVDEGRMTAEKSANELRGIRAIIETLQRVAHGEAKVGL